jgi:hypothetical protein
LAAFHLLQLQTQMANGIRRQNKLPPGFTPGSKITTGLLAQLSLRRLASLRQFRP